MSSQSLTSQLEDKTQIDTASNTNTSDCSKISNSQTNNNKDNKKSIDSAEASSSCVPSVSSSSFNSFANSSSSCSASSSPTNNNTTSQPKKKNSNNLKNMNDPLLNTFPSNYCYYVPPMFGYPNLQFSDLSMQNSLMNPYYNDFKAYNQQIYNYSNYPTYFPADFSRSNWQTTAHNTNFPRENSRNRALNNNNNINNQQNSNTFKNNNNNSIKNNNINNNINNNNNNNNNYKQKFNNDNSGNNTNGKKYFKKSFGKDRKREDVNTMTLTAPPKAPTYDLMQNEQVYANAYPALPSQSNQEKTTNSSNSKNINKETDQSSSSSSSSNSSNKEVVDTKNDEKQDTTVIKDETSNECQLNDQVEIQTSKEQESSNSLDEKAAKKNETIKKQSLTSSNSSSDKRWSDIVTGKNLFQDGFFSSLESNARLDNTIDSLNKLSLNSTKNTEQKIESNNSINNAPTTTTTTTNTNTTITSNTSNLSTNSSTTANEINKTDENQTDKQNSEKTESNKNQTYSKKQKYNNTTTNYNNNNNNNSNKNYNYLRLNNYQNQAYEYYYNRQYYNYNNNYNNSFHPFNKMNEFDKSVLENYNPNEFLYNGEKEGVKESKFFVIKSNSREDVLHSIKHSIWCSTKYGNSKLNQAFADAQNHKHMSVYLFFSVNTSGLFCGVAEMTSKVDFDAKSDLWTQDKWKGKFELKWIYVKDVPNSKLKHILLPNNDNKPVTHSRDAQEIPFEKGVEMLDIFRTFNYTSTIFDETEPIMNNEAYLMNLMMNYTYNQPKYMNNINNTTKPYSYKSKHDSIYNIYNKKVNTKNDENTLSTMVN